MGDDFSFPVTRREAVALVGVAAANAAWPEAAAAQSQPAVATVSGVVYEDRSGAGRRQGGDPGLAGVLVSNGREVVRTDAEGRYALPIEDGAAVFVIKPSGYAVPRDENNLPRFSYIHQPDGTPAELGLRYRGLDPTGPLPASVDFGLRRQEEPSRFDVILFTDPQPESHVELDFVRDTAVARAMTTPAAFGMTTGDIMFDDLSMYGRYNRMIGRIGLPWWHIGGNHDLNYEAPDARFSRETFKRVYGATYYAFEYGSALFIMLDNVRYLGADATKPTSEGKYEGRIGERQLAFVANLLKETPPDRLVVAAMHIPLRTDLNPNDPANNTADRDEFLRLLAGRPSFSISGHTHTTEHHYLGPDKAHHHHVLTAVCGSWWSGPYDRRGIACADSWDGTPNGFHGLSVDGNRYTTRVAPVSEPDKAMRIAIESQFHSRGPELAHEYRIEQLLGSPIPAEATGSSSLVVNVFDGGPQTRVSYRVGSREPVAMTHVRRPDPFVEQVYVRNAAVKKPWVKAMPSTHIWTARLPADLPPGAHRVTVTAVDEYGRTLSEAIALEVTGDAERTAARGI